MTAEDRRRLDRLEAVVADLSATVAALTGRRAFTEADAEKALDLYATARGLTPGRAVDFLAREVADHGALDRRRVRAFAQRLGALVDATTGGEARLGRFIVRRLQAGGRAGALWQLHWPW